MGTDVGSIPPCGDRSRKNSCFGVFFVHSECCQPETITLSHAFSVEIHHYLREKVELAKEGKKLHFKRVIQLDNAVSRGNYWS